jgi:hypothetical protein
MGLNRNSLQFVPRHKIIAGAPLSTRQPEKRGKFQPSPFEVPVDFQAKFAYQGKPYDWHFTKPYEADDLFAVGHDSAETYCLVEEDHDTEDGFSSNLAKNSIVSKLLRIHHLFTTRKIFEHFNVSNAIVLFLTPSETRANEILRLVSEFMRLPRRLGGGPGSSYVAVTHVPYVRHLDNPMPIPDLATRPWQRAGTEPFHLHK